MSRSFGKHFEDCFQQLGDAVAVLGGDGQQVLDAEAAEVFGVRLLLDVVHFVDGEEERLATLHQKTRKLHVGLGKLPYASPLP